MDNTTEQPESHSEEAPRKNNSVRRLILITSAVGLVFLVWYVFAERITPYTNQAIVTVKEPVEVTEKVIEEIR